MIEISAPRRLPVVGLRGGDPPHGQVPALAAELDAALRDTGFCYLADTGIDSGLVAAAFEANRRFHALPDEDKRTLAINRFHRGYIAPQSSVIRSSSVAEVRRPNLSESFMVMHEVAAGDPDHGRALQGPNQWPAHLPGFRDAVEAYFTAMTALARQVTGLLALALEQAPEAFLAHFERPTAWLRLLHYPPHPAAAPADQYGAAPHTDYGFITILAQDDSGGLQVRTRDGAWIDAVPRPGSFVLNVADMAMRWSNGRWPSTPHRVRNLSGGERYSLPFFFDPHIDVEVACLQSCVSAARPAAFEPVVYGDYVMERLDRNYAYRQPAAP